MRKAKPKKRILLPDPKFGDVAVTRFVNNLSLRSSQRSVQSINILGGGNLINRMASLRSTII